MLTEAPVLARTNNFRTKRLRHHVAVRVAVLPALVGASLVASATPAHADDGRVQHVTGTGTDGLWVHSAAGLNRDTVTTLLPEGSEILTDCVAFADVVGGTDPAWLHITSPVDGWVSDYYVDTSWDRNYTLIDQGLPECGSAPEADSGVPLPDVAPLHREAAAAWALAHARDVKRFDFSECAWFVSQALWAGGLPQTDAWNGYSSHGSFGHIPGTVAATAVDDFLPNLLAMYPSTAVIDLTGDRFLSNAVPEAEIGDVIAYDWEGDGDFDHVSIVTSISDGNYPNVAEWGTTKPLQLTSPYEERGWTWSAAHNHWLQEVHPGVTAKLYHFDTLPSF